ncbi:hypothetical protein BDR26DRAFT_851730 [Obelidium mucronatum]|nr:hypothetical protein BDR26DRAFT_851730 [Obelidium mucronatum]
MQSECIPIGSYASLCAPFTSNAYLNATALKEAYELSGPFSVEAWEAARTSHQTMAFGTPLNCQTTPPPTIPFYATRLCLLDIFTRSKGCNPTALPPSMCASSCSSYTTAVETLLADSTKCEPKPNTQLASNRDAATQSGNECFAFVVDADLSHCIQGVESDARSCGLAGNQDSAKAYCTANNNTPSCCALITPTTPSETGHAISIHAIMGIAVFALLLCISLATAFVIIRRQPERPAEIGDITIARQPSQAIFHRSSTLVKHLSNSSQPSTESVKSAASSSNAFNSFTRVPTIDDRGEPGTSSSGGNSTIAILGSMTESEFEIQCGVYTVIFGYVPQLSDEIALACGDRVRVLQSFDDGWSYGKNLATSDMGLFPSTALEYESPKTL